MSDEVNDRKTAFWSRTIPSVKEEISRSNIDPEPVVESLRDLSTTEGVVPDKKFLGKIDHDIAGAQDYAQIVNDYWVSRMRTGDPLFDQFMVDQLDSSTEVLRTIEETGLTSASKSSLSKGPKKVEAVDYPPYLDLKYSGVHMSLGHRPDKVGEPDTEGSIAYDESFKESLETVKKEIQRSWRDVDFTDTLFVIVNANGKKHFVNDSEVVKKPTATALLIVALTVAIVALVALGIALFV